MLFVRRSIAAALAVLCIVLASCSTVDESVQPSPSPSVPVEVSVEPSVEPSAEPTPHARVSTPPPPEDSFYLGESLYTPRTTVAFASDEDDLSRLEEMTFLHTLSLTIGDISAFDFSLIDELPSLTTLELTINGSADADLTALEALPLTLLTVRFNGEGELVLPKSETLESLTVQPPTGCESLVVEGYPLLNNVEVEFVGDMQGISIADCPAMDSISVIFEGSLGELTIEDCEPRAVVLRGPGSVGSVDAPSLEYLSLWCDSVGEVRIAERVEEGSIMTFCPVESVVFPADELQIRAHDDLDLDAFVGCDGLTKLIVDDLQELDFSALDRFPALKDIELKVGEQSVLEVSAEEDIMLFGTKLGADGKQCFISTSSLEELGKSPDLNVVYPPEALASLDTTLDAEQVGYLTAFCESGGLLQLIGRNP